MRWRVKRWFPELYFRMMLKRATRMRAARADA
jgi:hypothetical protein